MAASGEFCGYDDIVEWTTWPSSIVKCTIDDIYQLKSIRGRSGGGDGIFMLDQQPCRAVEVVGWVAAVQFDFVRKDNPDSDIQMTLTIDDSEGRYNITCQQTLQSIVVPISSASLPKQAGKAAANIAVKVEKPLSRSRYITKSELAAKAAKEEELRRATMQKRVLYFQFRVGDVVRVKGRIKEFRRRDGRWVRCLAVDQKAGGSIGRIHPSDEVLHVEEVSRARQSLYCYPFVMPEQPVTRMPNPERATTTTSEGTRSRASSIASGSMASPYKRRRIDGGGGEEGTASSSFSHAGSSEVGSSLAGGGFNLRYPANLDRKHITLPNFIRYVSDYLDKATAAMWPADPSTPAARTLAARYMPELCWPPRRIKAELIRRDSVKRSLNTRALLGAGADAMTPQANRTVRNRLGDGSQDAENATPTARSMRSDETLKSRDEEFSLPGAISLDCLMHVEHLRVFADRMLRQEYRKQEEKRKRQGLPSRFKDKAEEKAAFKQERRRKIRRLFTAAIRAKAQDEGSIIEVDLTKADREANQLEKENRKTHGADVFSMSFTMESFSSTLEHSALMDRTNSSAFDSQGSAGGAEWFRTQSSIAQRSRIGSDICKRPTDLPAYQSSESEGEDGRQSENSAVGYIPLTAPVIGVAIFHVLRVEQWDRSLKYIPKDDARRSNGLAMAEITKKISQLHSRWERLELDVVDAAVEELVGEGLVKRWGDGWWPMDQYDFEGTDHDTK